MARSATPSDAFNAVAEPRRRQILDLLARGERSVTDVATALGVRQPQASNALARLKRAGPVTTREAGLQRFYKVNAEGLRPVHDWVKGFERFWAGSFDRLD